MTRRTRPVRPLRSSLSSPPRPRGRKAPVARPPTRRRRRLTLVVALILATTVALIATVTVTVAAVARAESSAAWRAVQPTVPTRPTTTVRSAPTSPPLGSDTTAPASAPSRKPPTVTEGVDYSYLTKVNGSPIHWACTVTIDVTLVGSAPRGAQQALVTLAVALAKNSHLPLRVTPPVHSGPEYKTSTITVRYGKLGTSVGDLRIDSSTTLGLGGPQWDTDGVITSASLLVRNDTSLTDPQTSLGRHVLMHELAHTLGLGHAGQSDHELMAPSAGDSANPTLGVGDQYALAQVGCS